MLNPDLLPLREDCRVLQIDTTRGTIRPDGDGYVVTFAGPLVDLGNSLADVPGEVRCCNAANAEFELLAGCRRLQLAERRKVRFGRVYGWSNSEINSRPLSAAELSEYLASVEHDRTVKRMTRELADAVEQCAAKAAAAAEAAGLKDRYGLKPSKSKAKAEASVPMPSAKPKRSPSRGAQA